MDKNKNLKGIVYRLTVEFFEKIMGF